MKIIPLFIAHISYNPSYIIFTKVENLKVLNSFEKAQKIGE